jgi:GxxExxY protein
MLLAELLTDRVIGLAIEVHPRVKPGDHTGPRLLESVYELCLCREFADAGIAFARQVTIPVRYKGAEVGDGCKADIVVADELIPEIKAVSTILPIHAVQLRTCLRMSGVHAGLLLNFNVPRLVDGLHRYVV